MKIMLSIMILFISSFADVIMKKPVRERPDISLPIEKPVRPIRPIDRPVIVHQDNYYNSSYIENCDKYIEIISQQDAEISELQQELESLRKKEHLRLQEKLKATHEAELKKSEERKSSIKTTNIIEIIPK